MSMSEKACPIVVRTRNHRTEVLAFVHPTAGKQFVKGTIETNEAPLVAAERELREESGVTPPSPMTFLGTQRIGAERQLWHFFLCAHSGLPDAWEHRTEDDYGHTFAFFWHPLDALLDRDWHPIFHEAYSFFAPRLSRE